MAKVLGIMGSARHDGYTVRVLDALLAAAGSVSGVTVERVRLLDHSFGPCRSCYECIRRPEHRCILRDDMGGDGDLWRQVEGAHAMAWATPVHGWMADALLHLFVERLYPFIWSGELRGIPVATLAVASNQGFQYVAHRMLCQFAFTTGSRYVGGLAVHAAHLDESLQEAAYLGQQLAQAALRDEQQGRHALADAEHWLAYEAAPWSAFDRYLENLTFGTGQPERSLIRHALARGTFTDPQAAELLAQADAAFQESARHLSLGQREEAIRTLAKASALWTHATWAQFLEKDLIKAPPPRAYRPLE